MQKGGEKFAVGKRKQMPSKDIEARLNILDSRIARIEKYIFRSRVEQDVVKDGIAYLTVETQVIKQLCGELDNKLDSFLVGLKRIDAERVK